jgi:hypothetical protein
MGKSYRPPRRLGVSREGIADPMRDVLAMTRCGYCKRELVSVVHLLPRANPVCGRAACLALAFRDSECDESEGGTRSKQAA